MARIRYSLSLSPSLGVEGIPFCLRPSLAMIFPPFLSIMSLFARAKGILFYSAAGDGVLRGGGRYKTLELMSLLRSCGCR